jgi:hypothetical protein
MRQVANKEKYVTEYVKMDCQLNVHYGKKSTAVWGKRSLCRSMNETARQRMMAWQVLKKTHGKTSRWQRPLKAYGKENIDGKAVSRRTTKPPNTAKHKRHRRARLCLVFLTNAH